jgi:hypothetical protein
MGGGSPDTWPGSVGAMDKKTAHFRATFLFNYAKILPFFFPLASLLGSSLPYRSIGLIQFLDLSQAVGLL